MKHGQNLIKKNAPLNMIAISITMNGCMKLNHIKMLTAINWLCYLTSSGIGNFMESIVVFAVWILLIKLYWKRIFIITTLLIPVFLLTFY